MILLNDFFTISDISTSETETEATIVINGAHKIFNGHFPNQPVVPGVCMMQMIKEITEQVTGKTTNLSSAADMKFLAVIDPQRNNIIRASIRHTAGEQGVMNIQASLFKDELVHFKCKLQLLVAGH